MSTAARISLIYVIIGSLWIALSDAIAAFIARQNPDAYTLAETILDGVFIAVSAIVLYVLLRRDSNERQRSENKSLEREARFQDLFANNPLPMWLYDRSTLEFIDVNEASCAQYGYSREEFLKLRITDLRPPEDVPRLMSYLSQPTVGFDAPSEWHHRTKLGQIIDVETTGHPLEFAGKPAILVVILDITERKRGEAERLETEKLRVKLSKETDLHAMRNRFISMVSHEFRRPLTTITTSIELLEHYRSRMTEDAAQKHYRRIHEQLDETRELLDDFLALMRSEDGQMDFKPLPVELNDLCRKLVEQAKLSAGEDHSIRFVSACARITLDADEKLLRHALGNLLGNAVKYSPEGGEVQLELLHTDRIEIRIRDQGIGIPAEEQASIFDPFYRASNVGELSGSGLGLSITKQAIELHGGTLAIVKSDATGTEFLIALPVNERVFLTGC